MRPRTSGSTWFLFAIFALLLIGASTAADAADKRAKRIDDLLTAYHELDLFHGTALVAADGAVILEKGYGMANREWAIPNRPETRFRIGSITKRFTSMLVLQLVAEGRLDLDATLVDLLPGYREETGSRVTLHRLLNHTSGFPSYTGLPEFMQGPARDPHGVEEFIRAYCSGDLEFEPGSTFRYNNSGYFLLGAILEQATGKPYEQLLHERILDPLGMQSTGYDHHGAVLEKRASGYQRGAGGYRNADYLDMSAPYSAGAMYSTVQDLLLWDRALYGDELLPATDKEKMFEPGLQGYAYGWGVRDEPVGPEGEPRILYEHGGGINGFNTLITRQVDDRHLVVLFNNTGGAPLREMRTGIFDVLHGREPARPKPSIVTAVEPIVSAKGVTEAITEYRRLKEQHAEEYDFAEQELNRLGYRLLGEGDTEGAIEIFKLNVEMFPESFNPDDSLAEALAAAGQKELAVKNYARSLELNPANRNAVQKLVELTGAGD